MLDEVGEVSVTEAVKNLEGWSNVQSSTRRSDDVEKGAQVVAKAMMVEERSFCGLVNFL